MGWASRLEEKAKEAIPVPGHGSLGGHELAAAVPPYLADGRLMGLGGRRFVVLTGLTRTGTPRLHRFLIDIPADALGLATIRLRHLPYHV
jgi:hypothetical protein